MKIRHILLKRTAAYALLAALVGGPSFHASAQDVGSLLKHMVEESKEEDEPKKDDEKKKEEGYDKILKDATSKKGFITVHLKKGKVYFEIPKNLMGTPMLFSGRVAQISDNKDVIAGQMPTDPFVVSWSADDTKLYLHEEKTNVLSDPTSSIHKRVKDNALNPILNAFKIEAWKPDSTSMLIDVTSLFLADKAPVTAFIPASPFDALFGAKKLKGQYKKDLSSILEVAAYPTNVNVKVRSVYTVDGSPFTAVINASMLLLPEDVMRPRILDHRIGFFSDRKVSITTDELNMDKLQYVNRFRLEPKPEDIGKMKAGKLVEPKKPIVYYIDDAFPEEWWPFLKEGVEDWQEAFEAAGFKNAIIAKRYPKNDPDFDPNDARFNCIIYSSSQTSNAMGPSWTDPRSGEILQSSVYFYHNVLELLHSWRFVQTAAADPSARALNYDLKILGPMLRYLVAHEVGHTLGLMHNMGASSSYTIKQLRDPQFTSKWGTTPSIMDYARYNYIAQPGDGVKNFLPPRMGVYDIYAISWGYRPIFDAKTPKDEVKTLSKWIDAKAGDKRFQYGPQQIFDVKDPQSQTEDLGDDAIEASKCGISNLKITVDNLFKWTEESGKDYRQQTRLIKDINSQFKRYMGHCITYIGGYNVNLPVQGDGKTAVTPITKAKQKEALNFVIDQTLEYPTWMATKEVKDKLSMSESDFSDYIGSVMYSFTSTYVLGSVAATSELTKGAAYTPEELLQDLHERVWRSSGKLSTIEKSMQYFYIESLIKNLELTNDGKKSTKRDAPVKVASKGYLFDNLVKAEEVVSQRMKGGVDSGHYAILHHLIQQVLDAK